MFGVVQTHNRKTPKSLKIADLASAPMNKKRSKNNSRNHRRSRDAKWVRPKGYYCRYERERRGEGKRIHTRTKALLTLLNDIYEPRSATEKRMISYLACLVDKEFHGHSYRSHVSYIESHQGLLHMYGLKRVPSKGSVTLSCAGSWWILCSIFGVFRHFHGGVQLGRWGVRLGSWRTTGKRRYIANGTVFGSKSAHMEAARLPSRGSRLHMRLPLS